MRSSKLILGLCLALLGTATLSSGSLAQATQAGSGASSQPGSPVASVTALYARLTQTERSTAAFSQRAQLLAPVVDQVFNLQTVLQNSLGLRYRSLPDTQKQQLLEQFRQFTVARYVSNFAAGSTDVFKVDPTPTASPIAGDQIVHTSIVSPSGSTTDVNYVMRQGPGGWQVVDVLLNGNISQVAVQRADFGSSFSTGDATPLIDSLKKKTQAFSEG
ncbi:ABC transporter substrate-binding protein [Lichenicola cladoniae]|nr:ABC transporter substrate-binding protein [Lichenicola cladoniae]NPD68508.1 toluene transporter [Acetobacteraceae bacterium]